MEMSSLWLKDILELKGANGDIRQIDKITDP